MTSTSEFLREINRFLSKNPMGETTFGAVSCGNGKLVQRLKAGGTCSLETFDQVKAFMAGYTRKKPKRVSCSISAAV